MTFDEWYDSLPNKIKGPEYAIKGQAKELLAFTAWEFSRGVGDSTVADPEIMSVLQDVTDYAARNVCLHEETHRGGVIWTICDQCGMKWADDEGGVPENAHELPEPVKRAYDILSKYEW